MTINHVGVLIFPGAEELDFIGPWEMLTMWSRHADGPPHCWTVAERLEPVLCAKGLSVNPHHDFASCPALDVLLVPGGQGTRTEVNNAALVDFVRRQAATCEAVISVCTGSFVLHPAGLLEGRRATTHWGSLDRLRALPGVEVVEQRWVRDGPVWSTAGVSAGIDGVLAFIAATAGDDTAGKVQFGAEYYPDAARYGRYDTHPQAPEYLKR